MTLQITRGKSEIVYRISEYNQRQILVRVNRHNARWQHFESHDTPEEARQAILQLEKEAKQRSQRP